MNDYDCPGCKTPQNEPGLCEACFFRETTDKVSRLVGLAARVMTSGHRIDRGGTKHGVWKANRLDLCVAIQSFDTVRAISFYENAWDAPSTSEPLTVAARILVRDDGLTVTGEAVANLDWCEASKAILDAGGCDRATCAIAEQRLLTILGEALPP